MKKVVGLLSLLCSSAAITMLLVFGVFLWSFVTEQDAAIPGVATTQVKTSDTFSVAVDMNLVGGLIFTVALAGLISAVRAALQWQKSR